MEASKPFISAFVVTKNEEHNIEDCLKSIKWVDEIIIVDSGSTDNTLAICSKYTKNIFHNAWQGCGTQKRKALQYTNGEWVLCLDADERITANLRDEIINTLPNTSYHGFLVPFKSYYCQKAIKFGDWRGEKHLRVFKRKYAEIAPKKIHFKVTVAGPTTSFKNKIIHYSFDNFETVLKKMNLYSTGGAIDRYEAGKSTNIWQAILHALWTFLRGYIIKLGFLDGSMGFLLAVSNAEGCFYKYIKLRRLLKLGKLDSI